MPGAGTLDRRITIEQLVETQDDVGQPIQTWTERATVWAGRRDIRGRERFMAAQELAERSATWVIRFRDDVRATDRLIDDTGAAWDIEAVAELGRRQWLELAATVQQV